MLKCDVIELVKSVKNIRMEACIIIEKRHMLRPAGFETKHQSRFVHTVDSDLTRMDKKIFIPFVEYILTHLSSEEEMI